jgi:hypothetical protein
MGQISADECHAGPGWSGPELIFTVLPVWSPMPSGDVFLIVLESDHDVFLSSDGNSNRYAM